MGTIIVVFNKKGDPALPTVIDVLKNKQTEQAMNFTVASPEKIVSHKNRNLLNKQNNNSASAIGCAFTNETKKAYNFLQLDDSIVVFDGVIYTPIINEDTKQETDKKFPHSETQLQTLIEKVEGDYSFFMLKKETLTIARDPIGVQPLYYGENKEIAGFASNRKTLWQLGIDKTLSFPPGNICLLTKAGFQFKPIKTLVYTEPKQIPMDDAALKVQSFLEQAVRIRVAEFKEVAIAFSGGLDSSLIAYLASKCGVKVNLIHVSLENESETETAFEASEKLDLPMQVYLFKELDVEKTLPQVVDLIEEANPVNAAIGVPVYWTAQKAQEVGYSVLLAGHGADELFGGYQRYVNEYCKYGKEKAHHMMFKDIVSIHENNLERDKKICMSLNVELRVPFCSFDLVKFALGLPIDLKIDQQQDSLRKLVLRRVALNLGLPVSVVNKPKKAVQYSTGVNNAIKRIAQKNNQTVNEYVTELFRRKHQTAHNNTF